MMIFITWWSASNALTAVARSAASLSGFRFMLGLGEAGGFTVPPKAVSEWFPANERGLAVGIYSVGGAIGATIAPLLILWVGAPFGWRWTFLVTPVFALVWVALWLTLYRRPSDHPLLTDRERTYLQENAEPADPQIDLVLPSERVLWGRVIGNPAVWCLLLARFLTDPVWYFYQNWFAKYLYTARHLSQKELSILWVVFLAGDIGFLLGGFFSGRLVRCGTRPAAARLWIMLSAAFLVPLAALIPHAASLRLLIGLSMIVVYAHTSWLSNLTALVVDVVPKPILGTSFGLIACGSTLGGIFMNKGVAWLAANGGYNDCFAVMTVLHPTAILLVWWLGRDRRRGRERPTNSGRQRKKSDH
jgi:ACS family hexuronate transporter-like MFS transporter